MAVASWSLSGSGFSGVEIGDAGSAMSDVKSST
jgi:hypothetical protein